VPLLHIVVLALVQGITEFLPVSSASHLVALRIFTDWPDQGLALDVAAHFGALLAVLAYFWRDVGFMLGGLWRTARGKKGPGANLAFQIVVGSLPAILAGFLVAAYAGEGLRSLDVIAWATLGFGLLLWLTDRTGMTIRRIEHSTYFDALVIGLAQALALIPGASRTGVTMTAARLLGYERGEAARFSMLLGIPAITAFLTFSLVEMSKAEEAFQITSALFMVSGIAFFSALTVIAVMLAWLKRRTFTPFALYRVVLGLGLLAFAYGVL